MESSGFLGKSTLTSCFFTTAQMGKVVDMSNYAPVVGFLFYSALFSVLGTFLLIGISYKIKKDMGGSARSAMVVMALIVASLVSSSLDVQYVVWISLALCLLFSRDSALDPWSALENFFVETPKPQMFTLLFMQTATAMVLSYKLYMLVESTGAPVLNLPGKTFEEQVAVLVEMTLIYLALWSSTCLPEKAHSIES